MNRPEIRIIQDQQEEIKPADIPQNEMDMLLAKYGYQSQTNFHEPVQDSGLSFEEMIRQEELKNQQRNYEQIMKAKSQKP